MINSFYEFMKRDHVASLAKTQKAGKLKQAYETENFF
jgi:hypothetical protein